MEEPVSSLQFILDNLDDILSGISTPPDIEVSYYAFDFLLDGLRKKGKNIQETMPVLLKCIDPTTILPNKISNLSRKVKTYLDKGLDKMAVISVLFKNPEHELPDKFKTNNISYTSVISKSIPSLTEPMNLQNSDILYLRKVLNYQQLPWSHTEYWTKTLMCLTPDEFVDYKILRNQWNSLYSQERSLVTTNRKDSNNDLQKFRNRSYKLPQFFQYKKVSREEELAKQVEKQQVTIRKTHIELLRAYREMTYAAEEMAVCLQKTLNLKKK